MYKLDDNALIAMHRDLPEHMHGALIRYAENGIHPGSFLTAVLRNDLQQAFQCADDQNTAAMKQWVGWMTWHLPACAWKTEENIQKWMQERYDDTQAARQSEDVREEEVRTGA